MFINMGIWVFLYGDTKLLSTIYYLCEIERNYIYIVICQFAFIIFVNTYDLHVTYTLGII